MKITRRQLQKIISEAFIGQQGAPPIKIRTVPVDSYDTRKVSTTLAPESLDIILDRFISDYDSIKQLPQDKQYQAMLDRGYNIKIENFLKYGGQIKVLATSDDEENRMMALNLGSALGLFDNTPYEGLTGEDLVDAEIMGQQLLKDPKFADIGNVAVSEDEGKEADMQYITHLLNSKIPMERSVGISKLSGAFKNDKFIKQVKKKIDTAFKNVLPHIKESILDEMSYQIFTYDNIRFLPNPFEGQDIDEFAEEYDQDIMETIGEDFTGFQEIEELFAAGLNDSEVLNHLQELLIKSIKRAIEELIDAGLLEKIPGTNKFKMTRETYFDRKNQRSGRKEDIYKKSGLQLEPDHQHYVPNPNVPVVTEVMIRKIIREVLEESELIDEN